MSEDKKPKRAKAKTRPKEEMEEEAQRIMAQIQPPVPAPVGRPTGYSPQHCFKAIALGTEGKSKAVIAANLGVSIRTLYNWMQDHPEFLQAMEQAETLAQCWWEEAGQKGMFMQGFSAAVWSRSMSARFPRDWREQPKMVEHTGVNGGAIEFDVKTTISVDKMSDRALEALEEALMIIKQDPEGEDQTEDE